ncbi:MAG: flagellar filament capping protein FliD, partial [Polyangiaceae bacterium]|nr:flagellar filament capping protein FliD [Polyangiaceae bacterium]
MVGTITLTGLGSGMDIEGLVTGLVGASSQQLDAANRKVATQRAAVTTLTGISSLLSDLKGAIDSLDTASEVASFSATTSSNAIQATSSGLASPARYEISIQNLAQEQRTYSAAQTSSNDPLGLAGTMTISQGGTDFELTIDSSDSLDQIGSKLNAVGADVSASIFSDGSGYRLQLRSNDTGDDQAFTITQSGFDLGLQDPLATVQEAKDASVVIDGFTVTSSNNTIDSAIQGVTLELKEPSSDPIQLSVAADPVAMQNSLEDFVSKYNAVIGRIHSVAGFGGSKGTSEVLSGDSTLRTI